MGKWATTTEESQPPLHKAQLPSKSPFIQGSQSPLIFQTH